MKKGVFGLVFLIILIQFVSSVIINEIELNPEGGKSGNEWIELYNPSDSEIDISGWTIWDGLSSEKIRHTFSKDTILGPKEYRIITFTNSVLNNGGEYIIIKDGSGKEIDKSPELKEESSSKDTWQYCGDWIFGENTKNEKNPCPKEDEEEEIKENKEIEEKEPVRIFIESKEVGNETLGKQDEIELETITVESKDIKREVDKNNSSRYAIYGLFGFLVLIIILMSVRKRRYAKNEFA